MVKIIFAKHIIIVHLDSCLQLCVWEFCIFFFFFFFFFQRLWIVTSIVHACYYTMRRQSYYSRTVVALFTHYSWDLQSFYLKNIKNWSHGTIHIFKNYFATVFSFGKNKLYPKIWQYNYQNQYFLISYFIIYNLYWKFTFSYFYLIVSF